jgi:type II secretory pathway component HofQ
VQEVPTADDDAALREARTEFEDLVKRQIAKRSVQFIGEEARYGVRTIAQSLGPRRKNIDMPLAEREARGIVEEQKNRHWQPARMQKLN